MKKEYMMPQMEVVNIRYDGQLLIGSIINNVKSSVFEEEILPGTGTGRAPMFNDLEADFNALLGE